MENGAEEADKALGTNHCGISTYFSSTGPGPLLASITGWYPAYHASNGSRHLDQPRCHQKYGPVIRWGPDMVSFNTATAVQTIYGDSRKNNIRKADIYNFFDDGSSRPSTVSTLEKGPQSRKRRILSHASSVRALEEADSVIIRNVNRWCDLLGHSDGGERDWTEPKDMTKYCEWFGFDTAVDLAFGKTFDLLGNPEFRHLPRSIVSCSRLLVFVGHSPLLRFWKYVVRSRLHRALDSTGYQRRDEFIDAVRSAVAEREEAQRTSADRRDYFYWLMHAIDSETKGHYSIPEVEAECVLLWNAGAIAPAVALAGTFFYLSYYEETLQRVSQEIRKAFSSFESIQSGPTLNSCVYLRAVIEEALRLTPTNPGLLPRQTMPGGETVDGIFIPEGTILGVPAYCIHHNPWYYPEPYAFRPERWIADEQTEGSLEDVAKARLAFFSFSGGGSGCIGRPLAYQEMSIALARVLFRFDIQRAKGDESGAATRRNPLTGKTYPEFDMYDMLGIATNGPRIQFRRCDL